MLKPRKHYRKQVKIGDRFGQLLVTGAGFAKGSQWAFPCQCRCGKRVEKYARSLVLGLVDSCGCLGQARKVAAIARKTARWLYPGAVFGKLVCISRVVKDGIPTRWATCRCECGTVRDMEIASLRAGDSTSCGCVRREKLIATNRRLASHGCMMGDPELLPIYKTWVYIKRRCLDDKHSSFIGYGDSGICICGWLKESPRHLLELLGPKPSKKHSIDRYPHHNGHYTCGHCEDCRQNGWSLNLRWATDSEQQRNKGDQNRWLEAFGQKRLQCEWAEITGLGAATISERIKRSGWSVERALTTPDKRGNCYRPDN